MTSSKKIRAGCGCWITQGPNKIWKCAKHPSVVFVGDHKPLAHRFKASNGVWSQCADKTCVECWPSVYTLQNTLDESPADLLDMIEQRSLGVSYLTYAAEMAGNIENMDTRRDAALLQLLEHYHPVVREGAVLGLYKNLTPKIQKKLQTHLKTETSPGVRTTIEDALDEKDTELALSHWRILTALLGFIGLGIALFYGTLLWVLMAYCAGALLTHVARDLDD